MTSTGQLNICGPAIRALRKGHGWSLEVLAEKLENDLEEPFAVSMTPIQLSRIERQKKTLGDITLRALAMVLKVEIKELLPDT